MHPLLFKMGPLTLYSYGILVALAFMVGTLWTTSRAAKAGENVDQYLQAIFWIMVAGFTGARLLYVIYFPSLYLHHPLQILLDRGGLVWYGGLVAALMASLLFVWLKKISIWKFGDILVVPAAVGLAIGRVGCFMSGCCYGKQTLLPWGVEFPPGHETYPFHVHPTQLYESFALILLALLLEMVYRRSKTVGTTMSLFFIGYGIIRFLIEYLRGDVVYWIGHLFTASQVFSLLGVVGGLIMLYGFRKKPKVSMQLH
jgi:phosphatidylglycerol---prolipoprotein diacylglyceryl transferase